MKRVRLIQLTLSPQFVVDDGDTLQPVEPMQWVIVAADWPNVHALVDKFVADVQAQLDATAPDVEA